MGFLTGLSEGLTYVLERKAEKEAKEQDRAFQMEMYQQQLREGRRDKLLELKIARGQKDAEANAVTGQALAFYSRIGEDAMNSPEGQALRDNPTLAGQLEEQAQAIERDRKAKGINAPPLQGQNVFDSLAIYSPETNTVSPSILSTDELLALDVSDDAKYEEAVIGLTSSQGNNSYAAFKPDVFYVPDPDRLNEGRKAFDQLILNQAQNALSEITGEDAASVTAQSNLLKQIENYKTENSIERTQLQEKYGYSVFKALVTTDNPYIQDIKNDPQFSQFSTMYSIESQLRDILADPEASQADRDGATARLQQWGLN